MLLNMPVTGGLTYQNPAALGEMWWRFELRPTATRIANALSAQMLPRGQWITFDAADTFAPSTRCPTTTTSSSPRWRRHHRRSNRERHPRSPQPEPRLDPPSVMFAEGDQTAPPSVIVRPPGRMSKCIQVRPGGR